MSNSDDFKTFCESIKLDNLAEMETSAGEIAKKLNKHYYDLDKDTATHLYIVGSVGRKTAVKGSSDLDIIFDLPEDVYKKYNDYTNNGYQNKKNCSGNYSGFSKHFPVDGIFCFFAPAIRLFFVRRIFDPFNEIFNASFIRIKKLEANNRATSDLNIAIVLYRSILRFSGIDPCFFNLRVIVELTIVRPSLIVEAIPANQDLEESKPVRGCYYQCQQDGRKEPCKYERTVVCAV